MEKAREQGVLPRKQAGDGWLCGHDPKTSMRYAAGRLKGCKVCHREKQRLIPFNRTRWLAYSKANREKINAYARAWRAANRPRSADYRKGGPVAIEYARIISSDPCVYCGNPSTAIDHVTAVANGGKGDWMNLAPICKSCNSSKNSKDVLHFLMYRMNRDGVTP
jgi:5-methylcytosine-specific restriction endonuclease McrA